MDFVKNLDDIRKAQLEEPAETFDIEDAKVAVNNVLFMYMPPDSTLREVENLAVAIIKTMQEAWEFLGLVDGGEKP